MIEIGTSFGRYHIIEKLGQGGMAIVYKAFDTRLECDVAVKIIRMESLAPDVVGTTLKRFEREAKAVAQLTHPNIVKVSDYGEENGTPFLVMPYLPGGTLKKFLGTPMYYAEAARLLVPIAGALQYAHLHNIVHRDIKPSNILITETGEPMVTDFGVAKILDMQDGQTLTGMGAGVGTPEYMAPEQWMGKISPAVDVYSLGVVFYELVTGRKPFTADTPAAVLLKSVNDPLPTPSSLISDLPTGVDQVLYKALAKDPVGRYQTMNELATALKGLGREESFTTKIPSQPYPINTKEDSSLETVNDLERVGTDILQEVPSIAPPLYTEPELLNATDKTELDEAPKPSQEDERSSLMQKKKRKMFLGKGNYWKIIAVAMVSLVLVLVVMMASGWFKAQSNSDSIQENSTATSFPSYGNSSMPQPSQTSLPLITKTVIPTSTSIPNPTKTSEVYLGNVAYRTNCRQGPSQYLYPVIITLEPGTVYIQGRNADGTWLNIANKDAGNCWINDSTVTKDFDKIALPILADPPVIGDIVYGIRIRFNAYQECYEYYRNEFGQPFSTYHDAWTYMGANLHEWSDSLGIFKFTLKSGEYPMRKEIPCP